MIQAIYFDMDDTLYDRRLPFWEACELLFGGKLPFDRQIGFERYRIRGDEVFLPACRGEITMEEMYIYRFSRAMEDVGIKITPQQALEYQRNYEIRQQQIHISDSVARILDFCKASGCQLGVITNGPSEHQKSKFRTLKLDRWINPQQLFVSGDFGKDKPDPWMFDEALRRAGIPAEKALFIGDSYENDICGANAAGWKTIWLNIKSETPPGDIRPDHEVKDHTELAEVLQILIK